MRQNDGMTGEPALRRAAAWGAHLAAAAIAFTIAWLVVEPWRVDLRLPLSSAGDALPVAAHAKTILETGWYTAQPLLSAPYGQDYLDFPTTETTNFLALAILTRLTGAWALSMNLWFLLGFALAALTASWFLRRVGASPWLALAGAVLFAILPYHFVQGVPHLFVTQYWVVPLGAWLVWRVARGEPLWALGSGSGWRRLAGPATQTVAFIVLLGSSEVYYAAFTVMLIAGAALASAIGTRRAAALRGPAVAAGLVVAAVAANLIPYWVHQAVVGANPGGFQRVGNHAEYFALKLTQLLLPWSGHRIPALRELRETYDAAYPLPSEMPALGIVAAAGLVILLALVVGSALTGRRPRPYDPLRSRLATLGGLSTLALLIGTLGGLGSLVSLVTPVIRSWNRIAVVIGLLAIAAVALLVDAGIRRLARRLPAWRGRMPVVAAVLLIAIGVVDQTPGDAGDEAIASQAAYAQLDAYFDQVEDALEPGDWVLQLPYLPFPEAHTAEGWDGNDVLVPYLHTERIGWSGGGIRGRESADWTSGLTELTTSDLLAVAAERGAAGILFDVWVSDTEERAAYDGLVARLGQPLVDATGRYAFWAL